MHKLLQATLKLMSDQGAEYTVPNNGRQIYVPIRAPFRT